MLLITDDIKAEAYDLGFLLAGVTLPHQPTHLAVYRRWLDSGRHGQMAYLSRPDSIQRRQNPRLIMPECQSILSLALLYSSALDRPEEQQTAEIRGRVAAYAWGEDYHRVIPPRLDLLAEKISKILGRSILQRRYTDTGAILERDVAQEAGLGWIGKNTCLISPNFGSFFFLSELFLDVEIEPEKAFPFDRCGSCQRCIQACPTQCILPDRTIDATRCISYLTIENKGAIPVELRSQVGNWVFGCDICQEVCPWNLRFAPAVGDPAFAPHVDIQQPVLRKELQLTAQFFNRKFKHSPILRARRRGYLRNVCVALGNQPDSDAAPALASIIQTEPEPLIRSHAAWALGKIDNPAARSALEKILITEKDPGVREEIRQVLAGRT
jgi:epoxyqueuosine reductase